jgi:hypothetical protein
MVFGGTASVPSALTQTRIKGTLKKWFVAIFDGWKSLFFTTKAQRTEIMK